MSRAIDFETGLSDAWSDIAAFVPKLIAFLLVLIIGMIVAKLITKAVRKVLTKVDYQRAYERTGLSDAMGNRQFDAAGITSKIVYYALMLFVFIIAFSVFGTDNPVSQYLAAVLAYLPRIFVAIVIVVLAAAIGKAVKGLVEGALSGLSYSRTLGNVGFGVILALGIIAALNQLQVAQNVVNGILYAALAAIVGVVVVAVGGGGIKTMSDRWERAAQKWDEEKPRMQETRRANTTSAEYTQRVKTPEAPPTAPTSPVPGFDESAYTGGPTPAGSTGIYGYPQQPVTGQPPQAPPPGYSQPPYPGR